MKQSMRQGNDLELEFKQEVDKAKIKVGKVTSLYNKNKAKLSMDKNIEKAIRHMALELNSLISDCWNSSIGRCGWE